MLVQFFIMAFRNIMLAKRRTILLGVSLALVSSLFIFLRSLTQGITDRMIENATTLSAGHINVGGFYKFRSKSAAPLLEERTKVRNLVVQALPEAKIIDRQRGWGRIIGPASSINVGMSGINVEEEDKFFSTIQLADESEYKENGTKKIFGNFSDIRKKNTAIIFVSQAKKLGVGVGDTITAITEASGGQTNSVDLTVIAIAKDLGMLSNWNLFVPRQTVLDLYDLKEDSTGVIMVYLKDITKAEKGMALLHDVFTREGYRIMAHDPNPFFFKFDKVMGEDWLGQKLDLTLWKDEISFVLWVQTALDIITFIIISILSFIIATGIANAMWMSVRERIKEIGTMRAMGAERWQVLLLFLLEGFLLNLLFVGTASLVTSAAIWGLNVLKIPIQVEGLKFFLMSDYLSFSLSPSQIFKTMFLFCVVSMLGTFFPAMRAAKMQAGDALRQGK